MKKFLFFLSFTLASNSLFSISIFTKERYKKIVKDFVDNYFLKNVTTEINSLGYLKYIAEIYFDLLPYIKTYEDGLKRLDRYILSQNLEDIKKHFGFDENNKDVFFIPHIFQEKIKEWVNMAKTAKIEQSCELKIPLRPSNPTRVATQIANMFSFTEDEVIPFEKEEAEAFTQTLIKTCKKHIKTAQLSDIDTNIDINAQKEKIWNFTHKSLYLSFATGLASAALFNLVATYRTK